RHHLARLDVGAEADGEVGESIHAVAGVRHVRILSNPARHHCRAKMRLPTTAHTSRPWRIHELTRDFQVEDVWALPTPGGPGDFPRLVRLMTSFDPSRNSSGPVRALFAIRWKIGELLGWD